VLTHVRVPATDAELAADALWQGGASAVEERGNGDGFVTLVADAAPVDVRSGWQVDSVDEVDLAVVDTWRAHAEPVRAGTRIVVQPPWVARPVGLRPDDIVLDIDPGRAFGSGSHPTTRLVLGALERLVTPGSAVLDVGCGSGVLAVGAARLGAASVVALDVDPEALEATHENVRRNAVEGVVTVTDLPVGAVDGAFDLVVANIGLATITGLASALAARAPSLVLSGFLAGSWEQLLPAFPAFTVTSVLEEDGWLAVELHSRSFVRC
jgi:ribosomal protein L11 methyltransferase